MFDKIKKILTLLVLTCNLFSCCEIEEDRIPSGKENIHLSFILSLNNSDCSFTRGSNDISRSMIIKGEDYENQIDLNQFHVSLYTLDDNKFICSLNDITVEKTDKDYVYQFTGAAEFPGKYNKTNCKIVVFANCGSTFDSPENLIYNYSGNIYYNGATNEQLIPMWGVKPLKNFNPKKGENIKVGTINIIRSMAKIEVIIPKNLKYTFKGVTLHNYNKEGYMLPKNCNDKDYITAIDLGNLDNYWDGLFNEKQNLSTGKISFQKVNDKDYVIYMPEYRNSSNNSSYITVDLLDDQGKEVTFQDKDINKIFFKDYSSTSSDYNIIRNNHYKYIINSVNNGSKLDLELQVNPWILSEEEYSYTDNVTFSDAGKIVWDKDTYNSMSDNIIIVNNNADVAAKCKFTLLTPNNGTSTWFATLKSIEGGSTTDIGFEFYGPSTGKVGQEATLMIKPTSSSVSSNKRVRLYIWVKIGDRNILANSDYYLLQNH